MCHLTDFDVILLLKLQPVQLLQVEHLHMKYVRSLFTNCQSVPNFGHQQIVISTT
jgi:hypothetical protein